MKRTQIAIFPTLLLLTVIGCSDTPDMRDQRLAEFAEQAVKEQARQNDRMADQSQAVVEESHQLAETAKELVEHDAEARRELIAAQQRDPDLAATRSRIISSAPSKSDNSCHVLDGCLHHTQPSADGLLHQVVVPVDMRKQFLHYVIDS